jgi:hypothetical protein
MEVILIMTYKQIETSREIRLWITQVIVPALTVTTAVVTMVPELREAAVTKFNEAKNKIKYKLK